MALRHYTNIIAKVKMEMVKSQNDHSANDEFGLKVDPTYKPGNQFEKRV
jgi:hypothetical protein